MLPWGHAAVGYLLYTGWLRWRRGSLPTGPAVLALGLGTQTPDLIDKPLAWTFAVLPTGRSLGHSVLTLGVLALILVVLARRYDRVTSPRTARVTDGAGAPPWALSIVLAFLGGYGSHLGADTVAGLATGELEWAYLFYPVVSVGAPEHGYSFLEFFLSLTLTPTILVELGLTAVAIVVWLRDGRPGLATLWARTGGRLSRLVADRDR